MKKFSLIAVAMTATLALSACGGEDEPADETTPVEQTTDDTADETTGDMAEETGDSAAETGDAAGETGEAAYSEPACQEFFNEGGTLADRAEAARAAIDNGEIVDSVAMSEVTVLKSRIDAAAKEAPEDISALLLEVNAPFAEAQAAIVEGSEDVIDPESGAITLPEIDTQASADAQTELETVCAG